MADLSVEIAGLSFKNSVWLSAADTTINFDKMKLGIDAGAGAVISKSYSGAFHSGHEQKKPRIFAKACFLDSSWPLIVKDKNF